MGYAANFEPLKLVSQHCCDVVTLPQEKVFNVKYYHLYLTFVGRLDLL